MNILELTNILTYNNIQTSIPVKLSGLSDVCHRDNHHIIDAHARQLLTHREAVNTLVAPPMGTDQAFVYIVSTGAQFFSKAEHERRKRLLLEASGRFLRRYPLPAAVTFLPLVLRDD